MRAARQRQAGKRETRQEILQIGRPDRSP